MDIFVPGAITGGTGQEGHAGVGGKVHDVEPTQDSDSMSVRAGSGSSRSPAGSPVATE